MAKKVLDNIVDSAMGGVARARKGAQYLARQVPVWLTAAYIAAAPAGATQGVCENPSHLTRETLHEAHDRVIIPEVEVRVGNEKYKLGVKERLPPIKACIDDYVTFFPSEAIINLPDSLATGVDPEVKYMIKGTGGEWHKIDGPFKPEDYNLEPGLHLYYAFVTCLNGKKVASARGDLAVLDCAEPVYDQVDECIPAPAVTDSTKVPDDTSITSKDPSPTPKKGWTLGITGLVGGNQTGSASTTYGGTNRISSFERGLDGILNGDTNLDSPYGNFRVEVGRRSYAEGVELSHVGDASSRVTSHFARIHGFTIGADKPLGVGGELEYTRSTTEHRGHPNIRDYDITVDQVLASFFASGSFKSSGASFTGKAGFGLAYLGQYCGNVMGQEISDMNHLGLRALADGSKDFGNWLTINAKGDAYEFRQLDTPYGARNTTLLSLEADALFNFGRLGVGPAFAITYGNTNLSGVKRDGVPASTKRNATNNELGVRFTYQF